MTTIKKIRELLEKKHKKELLLILFLLVIGMLLEMAGIGLLIPAINFFMNKTTFDNYKHFLPDFLSNTTHNSLVIYFFICIILFFIIKSIYLIYLSYRQSLFTASLSNYLSNKLFQGYIKMPYSFFLNSNTSDLIKNIQSEVLYFGGICLAAMSIATEISAILGISILLMFVEPIGTITLVLFFLFSAFFFNKISGIKMKRLGQQREQLDQSTYKQLIEGLSGTKEIKIFSVENYFFKKFLKLNEKKANVHIKVQVLNAIPRLYLENLTVIGISILIIVVNIRAKNPFDSISIISLFVGAAFRLLPSVNKILNSLQTISFAVPIINILHREVILVNQNENSKYILDKTLEFNNYIAIKNLSYQYDKSDKLVLNNINIQIKKGELVGIIGKTGSGKSTLINLLIGLLKPTNGDILIDNLSIYTNTTSWQKSIGYVPQNIYLTDDTIKNNIAFGIENENIDDNKINNAIKLAQLENYISNLENGIDTIVGERGVKISGGERQRIGIARALYNNPPILILDEATSSLDIKTESEFMLAINNLHKLKTIVIIAHRLSTIEKCDVVYEVKNTEILLKNL